MAVTGMGSFADRIGGTAAILSGVGVAGYAATGAGTDPVVRDDPAFLAAVIAFAVWGVVTAGAGVGVLLGVRFARPSAAVLAGLAALVFGLGASGRGTALDYVAIGLVVVAGIVAVFALGYGRVATYLAG
jgi:hypothetical protein